jgi:hypothetical protein
MGVAEGEGFFFLPDGSFYKGGIVKNKANSVISSYYSADSSNTFSYNG